MSKGYTVKLVARNEGIEYRDDGGVYRFNVALANDKWVVYLPCSKGDLFEAHELTAEEQERITPRIAKYLEGKKYFGVVGPSYPVVFEREPAASAQVIESRRHASEYWQKQGKE
jgi:hypothetical protein